jgi:hypothetical protein
VTSLLLLLGNSLLVSCDELLLSQVCSRVRFLGGSERVLLADAQRLLRNFGLFLLGVESLELIIMRPEMSLDVAEFPFHGIFELFKLVIESTQHFVEQLIRSLTKRI